MNAHSLEFPDACFDVVISTEVIEHDDEFWTSIREMGRVLRSRGWLILTARGNGFMLHGYPDDYWRFMPSAFPRLLRMAGCEVIEMSAVKGNGLEPWVDWLRSRVGRDAAKASHWFG